MSVETQTRSYTPNLARLDVVTQPGDGGRHEPFDLNDTLVIARPPDRKFPRTESSDGQFKPLELSPGLRVNPELEKARFYTRMEMQRFIYDINAHRSAGKSLAEAVALSTNVFEFHIRSYDAEIIEQNPVLLHLNRFGVWNGEERVLGNNGRPVVDGVDEAERSGSVKRVSEKIEEFLLTAENNSFIVLMSPQGVSGYLDEDNQDIPHLNTQTMVFWKDQNGELKGLTLVTDLTIDQTEKVMGGLGAPANFFSKKGSEMERVSNIVENPAKISLAEEYKNPFLYVLDRIIAIRGRGDIHLKQKNGEEEIRSIQEVEQAIVSFESLLNLSLSKQNCLTRFRELILNNIDLVGQSSFQQTIAAKAEETVLLFGKDYLDRINHAYGIQSLPNLTHIENDYDGNYQPVSEEVDFAVVLAFLQSRGGCPTGSSAMRALGGVSSALSSDGMILLESDSMGPLYFPCPKCKAINKRPREGYVENCQNCGTDAVACKPSAKPAVKLKSISEDSPYELKKAA